MLTPCLYPASFFVPQKRPNPPPKPLVGQGLYLAPKEGTQCLTAGYTDVLRFQAKQLLLIAMLHRRLDWQDGVEVIPAPLHTASINVAGVFYRDELPVHQLCDVLHHRGHGKMYRIRDRAVAGMTLMCPTIFAVEQVGVDRDGSVTDVQEKQFIGQREKVLAVAFEHRNHVLIQQSATVEFGNLLRSHVFAHMQLGSDLICTRCNKILWLSLLISQRKSPDYGIYQRI